MCLRQDEQPGTRAGCTHARRICCCPCQLPPCFNIHDGASGCSPTHSPGRRAAPPHGSPSPGCCHMHLGGVRKHDKRVCVQHTHSHPMRTHCHAWLPWCGGAPMLHSVSQHPCCACRTCCCLIHKVAAPLKRAANFTDRYEDVHNPGIWNPGSLCAWLRLKAPTWLGGVRQCDICACLAGV